MLKQLSSSGLRWLWVAVFVFILDRSTKFFIFKHFLAYDPLYVNPYFNLVLAYNKGAAFSFLAGASGWQSWVLGGLAIIVSLVILLKLKNIPGNQRWMCIALACIVGGALGNLYDRLTIGYVIDFIQLHISHYYWPVFNIADSAICIGAAMLFFELLLQNKKKRS